MRRGLVLFLVASLVVGCDKSSTGPAGGKGGSESSAKDGTKKLRFAVIPKGTSHEFWRSVHAGAENAAKELGGIEILWKGPQLENDREGQIAVVQGFIAAKVDAICLAPLDKQALVPYVNQAADERIPVVIFDSGIDDESKIVSYVATDNYQGGVLAARRMAESLKGKDKNVILLRYNQGSESTERREQGFLDTLAKEFPDVKVISSDQYSGITPEDSLTKATQVLSQFKGRVNGIFAVCEPNAAGTLGALRQVELDGKVIFIAFDPNADLIRAMAEKKVHGIVLQDPVKIGYEAVKALHKSIKGEKVEKRINTGEFMATPENMNEPRMQELLKPQQF